MRGVVPQVRVDGRFEVRVRGVLVGWVVGLDRWQVLRDPQMHSSFLMDLPGEAGDLVGLELAEPGVGFLGGGVGFTADRSALGVVHAEEG